MDVEDMDESPLLDKYRQQMDVLHEICMRTSSDPKAPLDDMERQCTRTSLTE